MMPPTISFTPSKVGVLRNGERKEFGEIEPITVEQADLRPTTINFTFKLKKRTGLHFLQDCGIKKKPKFTYKTNKNYFKK